MAFLIEENMKSNATQKLSPLISLTSEQQKLVNLILSFSKKHLNKNTPAVFTIYGDAGTGKSVVLSKLFYEIQLRSKQEKSCFYHTNNFFLVNHPELLKVYKQIASNFPELLKKQYQRPTSFINQLDKTHRAADIVLIDEAHLLLSKPDHYNNFYFNNQLEEIIKRSKIVILVFDSNQVLKMKTFWNDESLKKITNQYFHQDYHLKHQFRLTASNELINWFDNFTEEKELLTLPKNIYKNYDFKIFSDAEEMRKAIVEKNRKYGLSRILSTSGYPSILDGGRHYIKEGNFQLPWDQYNYSSTPWAEIPETINEVGSIYTCQGFDLNYTGIIIGPPFEYDPIKNKIIINIEKITDTEIFKKRNDISDNRNLGKIKEKLVLNSLNVLFKRGVYGTYLYAHNSLLRNRLLELYNLK